MNPKILFGIDYIEIMLESEKRQSKGINNKIINFSKFLLAWDWGFIPSELKEVHSYFIEKNRLAASENFSDVVKRMVNHLKNNNEAKSTFVRNMILISYLDEFITDEEEKLIIGLAIELGFQQTEIDEMSSHSMNRFMALKFYLRN